MEGNPSRTETSFRHYRSVSGPFRSVSWNPIHPPHFRCQGRLNGISLSLNHPMFDFTPTTTREGGQAVTHEKNSGGNFSAESQVSTFLKLRTPLFGLLSVFIIPPLHPPVYLKLRLFVSIGPFWRVASSFFYPGVIGGAVVVSPIFPQIFVCRISWKASKCYRNDDGLLRSVFSFWQFSGFVEGGTNFFK